MSNVILSNTSGQIDFTLRESYARLTGSFVGPSGNAGNGFTIQDGAKNTGIFVGNSCIQVCKNILDFKQNSNLNLLLPNNNCFVVSGNGSNFIFNQEGSVSFGSGVNSNYKGIQSYSTNPSLTLINSNGNCNQAIRFLNCVGTEIFNICQFSGCGTQFSGRCLGFFTNTGPSICLSGDYASFNAPINLNFNHFFSGSNYFSGDSYLRGNTTGSGIFCYFNSTAVTTGLDISTHSVFRCSVRVENSVLSVTGTNSCIFSSNCVCSPTGCFVNAFGTTACYSNFCGNFCVNNIGCLGVNGLCLTGNQTHVLSGICTSGINLGSLTAGSVRAFVPNGFGISGSTNITGAFFASGVTTHCIYGNSICLVSTAAAGNLICGNTCNSGNFCSSNTGCFQAICSYESNSTSTFCGPVNFCKTVSAQIATFTNLTGDNIYSNNILSGVRGIFNCFEQLNGSEISCFCSSGLNVGLSQTGVVKSINTSKAWGILSVSAGTAIFCTGYNLKSTQIYAQGPTSTQRIYAHGICFSEPIKYPFTINFNVYGLSSAITGVSATDNSAFGLSPSPPGYLGFTGASTTTNLVVAGATATSPFGVQFYTSHGRCSSTSSLAPFTVGSTYSEIYFNLENSKGPYTPYSELTRNNACGVIHYNILGY